MATNNGASSPRFRLIKAADLRHLPPAQLIASTHLVSEGLNVIFGPSGSYKSFYTLGLALSIAQKEGVVYVAAEGSSGLHIRVEAWCDHNKTDAGSLQFICEEVNLLDGAQVTRFVNTIKGIKATTRLIIFDTYARCMPGGDENSAKDTGLVIRHIASLQRSLKAAVALVHHSNRAETGERGSGALRGAADMMIEVSASDDTVRIECGKSKDYEAWPAERWRFQPVGKSGLLLPASDVNLPPQMSTKEVKILEALNLDIFEDCGARIHEVIDATGISRAVIFRLLSKLKTGGFIHQDKRGNPFSLTSKGRKSLFAIKPELEKGEFSIEIEV
jgi:predicted transcriptional regulator